MKVGNAPEESGKETSRALAHNSMQLSVADGAEKDDERSSSENDDEDEDMESQKSHRRSDALTLATDE